MNRNLKSGIGALLVAMLLVGIVLMPGAVAKNNSEEADAGILSVNLYDGALSIDETGGITALANSGSYQGNYTPGLKYNISVHYTYKDTNDAILGTAKFKLTGPDGTYAEKSIFDFPLIDNDADGYLSVTFTPNGPGAYHWTTLSSERSESDSNIGDLILS